MTALLRRLKSWWRLKLAMAAGLSAVLCVPYFLVGNHPLRQVRHLPLTSIDKVIGFHPLGWTWIYQSAYLVTDLIPLLATTRGQLRRYATAFISTVAVSIVAFVIFPIRGPQPTVVNPSGMYRLLKSYDVTLNSCPSLHVSLLVLTLAFGWRVAGRSVPRWLSAAIGLWGVLIGYSTLATKEHFLVDVLSGAALGWAADAWAWRKTAVEQGI